MASAVDSRLAYARLSAVATASRLPTANRGSNNSYTTSWDTTIHLGNPGLSHPQGETGLTRRDDGIALILIAEPPKKVIKLAIHLGNPG